MSLIGRSRIFKTGVQEQRTALRGSCITCSQPSCTPTLGWPDHQRVGTLTYFGTLKKSLAAALVVWSNRRVPLDPPLDLSLTSLCMYIPAQNSIIHIQSTQSFIHIVFFSIPLVYWGGWGEGWLPIFLTVSRFEEKDSGKK